MPILSSRHRLFRDLRFLSSSPSPSPAPQTISISAAKSKLRSEHDPDKALAIFSSLSDRLSSPVSSRYALDLAVRRLAKSRRFSDIETLIESQKTHPHITKEPFLTTLILAYGRARMADRAIQTFYEMDRLGTPRSAISFNALLTACNQSQKFDQVPKLFSEISQNYGIAPNKVSYGILIKSLCESGLPESAISILKEMEEKGIEITTVTYTTILDSLYKKGRIEDAERIWNEMSEKGCLLDVATYNVKIMHAAQHKKQEEVLKLIEEMTLLRLKPDTISYNYLMTCYCKNGQMDDAKKVYEGLQENGCLPNAATFRIILHYLCKKGDFNSGLKVFSVSATRHKIPDFGTMKSLVEGLAKTSKLKEAKGVIAEVKKRFPESFLNSWKKVERELGFIDEGKGSTQAAT